MTGATTQRIRQAFLRGMASYGDEATVQAAVAEALANDIGGVAPAREFGSVLEFGCGTGFLTRALLSRIRAQSWLLNDLVPESKAVVAELFAAGPADWSFQPGPIETLPLPGPYDLIASASTVQWVRDTPALLTRLAAGLAPGGVLALASYAPRHYRELSALGLAASTMSYHGAEDWQAMLPTDMTLHQICETEEVVHFSTPRAVLHHLRRTGVNGAAQGRWSRRNLAAFEAEYASRFRSADGGVTLTYAPVRLVAIKTPA